MIRLLEFASLMQTTFILLDLLDPVKRGSGHLQPSGWGECRWVEYLSFPVLRQAAGLKLLRQHGEQLQQRQAARPPVHPSPLLLEPAHHLGHGTWPGLGHGVERQWGQRHAQPGEHHFGARGEAGNLGEQLRLQGLVLVGGDVGPVAGDLGVERIGAKVLDFWDLWTSARQRWTGAFSFYKSVQVKDVCPRVCTAPCRGSAGPSRTAKPAGRLVPASAISGPDFCSLY